MTPVFTAWLSFAWQFRFDGGGGDHTSAHDDGGETNCGVILETWNEAVRRGIVTGALADATPIQLATVLYVLFWEACGCDHMHPAVAGIVFNMAMADGVGGAGKLVERLLGVPVDNGIIGEVTLTALNKIDPARAIDMLTVTEETFEEGLASFKYFGHGWRTRNAAAELFARTMLPAASTPDETHSSGHETLSV